MKRVETRNNSKKKKKSDPIKRFSKLVQVMRTSLASADRQGKGPVLMHFGKPKKEAIQQGALNIDGHKLLDNVGGEAFDYGSFKSPL